VPQVAQGELDDPVRVPRLGAFGVLADRDAEEDHTRNAEAGELPHFLAEGLAGVLHDAGKGRNRGRAVDALPHEERCHHVVDADPSFGDQSPQRRCAAQPSEAPGGEPHAAMLGERHPYVRVIVGTARAADWLPAASVPVTTKRLTPRTRLTFSDQDVAPAASWAEAARGSPASLSPFPLTSTHARTSAAASAVPLTV